ncbi:MAG: tetratricopeptide repeat protein [Deltaproteobacteria bacterium]|nr:tetratricopeptide repeat protein [Deltaproteobacteria bacterium]
MTGTGETRAATMELQRLAAALASAKRWAAAEVAAALAVESDPRSADAWMLLGMARAHQGEGLAAIRAYQRVVAERPKDVEAWTALGELHLQRLEYDGAAAALREAMQLDPAAQHPAGRRARFAAANAIGTLKASA